MAKKSGIVVESQKISVGELLNPLPLIILVVGFLASWVLVWAGGWMLVWLPLTYLALMILVGVREQRKESKFTNHG